jgi:hypothetical protein
MLPTPVKQCSRRGVPAARKLVDDRPAGGDPDTAAVVARAHHRADLVDGLALELGAPDRHHADRFGVAVDENRAVPVPLGDAGHPFVVHGLRPVLRGEAAEMPHHDRVVLQGTGQREVRVAVRLQPHGRHRTHPR